MNSATRLALVLSLALCACDTAGKSSPAPIPTAMPTEFPAAMPPPTPLAAAVSTLQVAEGVRMEIWVDNPTPAMNSTIVIRSRLVGSAVDQCQMMYATWPEKGGTASCSSLVVYESGKCPIEVQGYPSGQFVPVTVTIETGGAWYTAHTGFTPR
jgi:hypothetical protein